MNTYSNALRLHRYIAQKHWDGQAIAGPDPIGKIHWRITRFIRSYLPKLPGDDRYVYLQGQAYWIRGNLALWQHTQDPSYLDCARSCADYVVRSQPADGAWRHPPIRGRKGFISTVEGVWASLGLLAAYQATGHPDYLSAALKWHTVQTNRIGFQQVANGLAANYYAHASGIVPNVTTMLIWLTAELHAATGDPTCIQHTAPMVRFIAHSQLDSGELPYAVNERPHFMCYQYNAFQFMDLAHYYRLTGDDAIRPGLEKLAAFLSTGLTESGSCRYNCFKTAPRVHYWTAALGAALHQAHQLGLGDYETRSDRAYRYLSSRQRPDGGFDFSERNYGFLRDRRSYPRYLAMILVHLLERQEVLPDKPQKG